MCCRLEVTEDGKKALIDLSQGDMRKVLNILQSSATAFPTINEEAVYTCVGHPLKADITNILKWLLNDDFHSTFKSMLSVEVFNTKIYLFLHVRKIFFVGIQGLRVEKGLALQDILTEVHAFLHRSKNLRYFCIQTIFFKLIRIIFIFSWAAAWNADWTVD